MPCTFTALSVVHSGTFALPSQLFIDCLSGMGGHISEIQEVLQSPFSCFDSFPLLSCVIIYLLILYTVSL